MTALYGPQTANAVTEKPTDPGQRYGNQQTWFKNCSGPGATDGTVPDAAFYNRLVGALDYLLGASGISALPGDDSAIYRAVIQVFEGAAPTAMNSLKELADALGGDPNFSATIMTMLGNRLRFDAGQTLTSAQKAQAVANLALAAVAVSGAYSDLSGKPTLGTAAALNVGTGASQIVQLDGSSKLPAVDGSQLTNVNKAINQTIALAASQDFNAVTTPGVYYTVDTASVNPPSATQHWYLEVEGRVDPTNYVAQIARRRSDGVTFTRVLAAAAWSAWKQVTTSDTLGTAAVLNTGTAAGQIPVLGTGGKLPAVDGSLLTNLSAVSAALASYSAALAADIALGANTWTTTSGPSLALPAGTFLVIATASFKDTAGGEPFSVRIANAAGSTIYGTSGIVYSYSAGSRCQCVATGIVTLASADTVYAQGINLAGTTTGKMLANESGASVAQDTKIIAVKIA